jgi:hypothetical protein
LANTANVSLRSRSTVMGGRPILMRRKHLKWLRTAGPKLAAVRLEGGSRIKKLTTAALVAGIFGGAVSASDLPASKPAVTISRSKLFRKTSKENLSRFPGLPIHRRCLVELGMHLGELWQLTPLSNWLRANKRSRFLLTAPPLRLPGSFGSPMTPVATV